jgi:hypothetical protein
MLTRALLSGTGEGLLRVLTSLLREALGLLRESLRALLGLALARESLLAELLARMSVLLAKALLPAELRGTLLRVSMGGVGLLRRQGRLMPLLNGAVLLTRRTSGGDGRRHGRSGTLGSRRRSRQSGETLTELLTELLTLTELLRELLRELLAAELWTELLAAELLSALEAGRRESAAEATEAASGESRGVSGRESAGETSIVSESGAESLRSEVDWRIIKGRISRESGVSADYRVPGRRVTCGDRGASIIRGREGRIGRSSGDGGTTIIWCSPSGEIR